MNITKKMLESVKKMEHSEQILQHYNLYKHYKGNDSTKSDYNKNLFLIMGKFKTSR